MSQDKNDLLEDRVKIINMFQDSLIDDIDKVKKRIEKLEEQAKNYSKQQDLLKNQIDLRIMEANNIKGVLNELFHMEIQHYEEMITQLKKLDPKHHQLKELRKRIDDWKRLKKILEIQQICEGKKKTPILKSDPDDIFDIMVPDNFFEDILKEEKELNIFLEDEPDLYSDEDIKDKKKEEIKDLIKKAVDDESEFYKKYNCYSYWSKNLIAERMKQNGEQKIADLLNRLDDFIKEKSIPDDFGFTYLDPTDLELFIENERKELET